METFDELYEEQLNELMGSVGRRLANRIAAIPDRILVKLGGQSAKGRLTLRALSTKLHDEFREFCGEQRIRQPLLDDVIVFLRKRLGVTLDDKTSLSLAYGAQAAQPAADRDDIEDLINALQANIENNLAPDRDLVAKLLQYARKGGGNEVTIRQSLFRISRSNPTARQGLAPLRDFIGSKAINTAKLNMLFQRVAQLILKVSSAKEGGEDAGEQDFSSGPKARVVFGRGSGVNDNLNEGVSEGSAMDNIRNNGGAAFFEELESYGISANMLRSFGNTYQNNPQSLVDLINSRYSDEMCVKISRCVLQLFTHPSISKDIPEYTKLITDKAEEAGLQGFDKMLDMVIRLMRRPRYDKGQINMIIYNKIRGENMSAGFLARVIISAYLAGRKFGFFRSGG